MKIAGQGIGELHARSASLLVLLLLCADVVFIVLHFIYSLTPFISNPLFSLENDKSYPEVYQYLKWFWIMILFAHMSMLRRSPGYVAWALVFAYFLCDDALSIHERVGSHIAGKLSLAPPLGLRLQDLGELAVSTAAGLILLAIVAWAYLRGSQAFRKMSHDMLLLVLALVFFGVGVDMVHVSFGSAKQINFILGVVEDGGEMLVASLILWYVFLSAVRDENATSYLCDSVRSALTRRSI